jgi:PKHD-type hydroxylase
MSARPKAFLVWENLFGPSELDAIEQLGDQLTLERAELANKGDINPAVRSTRAARLVPGPETSHLYEKIGGLVRHLNETVYHFDVESLEPIQYTVYYQSEGGHYDWHTDYGPENPRPRKISMSLQLSDGDSYEGCDLQFQVAPTVASAPRTRGTIIAFPSFFLHRVTPIVSGTRKSLVIWATGPNFR